MTAPVLTQTSAATVNPLQWDSDFTGYVVWDGSANGDKQLMRWRRVNGGAWTTEAEQGLDDELISGGFTWPLWEAAKPLASGYVEVQEQRVRYVAGVELLRSAWSNSVTDAALAAPPSWPATYFVGGTLPKGAYYDISNIGSLWKDTAGTSPVTAAGDAVARVDDLSGNGHHVLQATAGKRPLYQTAGGKPYLDFDGTDDALQSASFTAEAQPHFIGMSLKSDNPTQQRVIFDGIASGNHHALYHNDSPNSWSILAGNNVTAYALAPNSSPATITALINASTSYVRQNGTQSGTGFDAGSNTLTGITIGAFYDGSSIPWDGRWYGGFVIGVNPDATTRTNAEAWLTGLHP